MTLTIRLLQFYVDIYVHVVYVDIYVHVDPCWPLVNRNAVGSATLFVFPSQKQGCQIENFQTKNSYLSTFRRALE
jgi:hypothetical protein